MWGYIHTNNLTSLSINICHGPRKKDDEIAVLPILISDSAGPF